MNKQKRYQAYLLRLQRGQQQAHWRATLQDAETSEIYRFATEHDLVRFLLESLKNSQPIDTQSID